MEAENDIKMTAFDNITQTREIQMLKTVIPYMKNAQKKQFAILIKYMELQKTIQLFSTEESALSICSLPEEENNTVAMLNDLRKFCTPRDEEVSEDGYEFF